MSAVGDWDWGAFIIGAVIATVGSIVFHGGCSGETGHYRYLPPCGYGASEVMVREADGRARVVCGCPR